MKRKYVGYQIGLACLLLYTTAVGNVVKAAPVAPPINPPVSNCNVTKPSQGMTPALLTSGLPCAATLVAPFDLDNLQFGFDFYSWLSFLALNSPADGKTIGKGPGEGGDAPTQWEQWKDIFQVMLPDGAMPDGWGQRNKIPDACAGLSSNPNVRVVRMDVIGTTHAAMSSTVQPFDSGPLIDQHGMYARFEILVNKPMFEYIVQNGLYSKQGQAKFTNPIAFPDGFVTQGTNGAVGAIMVKAAWKVMGKDDDPAHFHTADALVYVPASAGRNESCHKGTLGLVGLHVAHKTKDEPQWLWSTYEHVDNVPGDAEIKAGKLQAHYNFYNPRCNAQQCPPNVPPPRPWNSSVEPFPNGFTSQITRVVPITDEAAKMNQGFAGILKGTVWQNYMLVSTQWPTDAASKTDPTGAPFPPYLANTTLESYIQGRTPQSSSNCTGCHNNATATSGRNSDFTYILERAK